MSAFVLLAQTNLAASKTFLQQLLVCLSLTLDSEELFCWYKWKPLVRLDMSNIYIHSNLNPLTNFTSSSRSTKFKYILSWIVISYAMKLSIPLWISWKVNGNWDNKMIRISKWRESQCRTNSNVKGRKKSKRAALCEPQSGMQVGKLTTGVRSYLR